MIRRVNAVLGWEASKKRSIPGRGDARKNGALARGLLDLPTHRTGCDKLVAVDYIYIFPTKLLLFSKWRRRRPRRRVIMRSYGKFGGR